MNPIDVRGEAFSSYYFEKVFRPGKVDAAQLHRGRKIVGEAYRILGDRQRPDAVLRQLFQPLSELLGWSICAPQRVTTMLGEEDGGYPVEIPGAHGPVLRVFCSPPNEEIDLTPPGKHRRAALPAVIERVLEATKTPYALVANRHELRIVRSRAFGAPGALAFDLLALRDTDASIDRAWAVLFALLAASANAGEQNALDRALEAGRKEMVGVGKTLGVQVREAIEVFVSGLYASAANRAKLPSPDDDAGLDALYAQTLRILYRCLFTLYAEARGLVPMDLPIYRESYSLVGAAHYGAAGVAARLRATFELLRRGVDMGNGERIPAFGGAIFAPDAVALLDPLDWGDEIVYAMLRKLVFIELPGGQGLAAVSYRELDEERLGSIYEGLLELRLRVAQTPMHEVDLQGRIIVLSDEQLANLQGGRGLTQRRAIAPGDPYLASSSGRKETASYYTARELVEFLVRETIDPLAADAEPSAILALRVVDPAMGSGHFLVGAVRRLAEHLVDAYQRVEERDGDDGLPKLVRGALDDERELLRVCRQLVAAHCIYGVDKNPLAIDLARVALWLATASAGHPLSFLDHRLKCGDGLLGMSVDGLISVEDLRPKARRGGAQMEFLQAGSDMVPEHDLKRAIDAALEQTFRNLAAFAAIVDDEDTDFDVKRERAAIVERSLQPLRELHDARVGRLLAADETYLPILAALKHFATYRYLGENVRESVAAWIGEGRREGAFCWEVEFPEVFYRAREDQRVERRPDAGFDVVLGNPPWDKLLIDRRQFYYRYDPLIVDAQGATADRRISAVNDLFPQAQSQFDTALSEMRTYAAALQSLARYVWQRVAVEGEMTGGHPDCYKYFLEQAWLLAKLGGRVGMVTPAAFTSDAGATGLRRMLLLAARLETLFVFENRKKLFDIHTRFKFQVVSFRRGGQTEAFEAAFWLQDIDLLRMSTKDRAAVTFSIRVDDVKRMSGERLVILEARAARDYPICSRMQGFAPPLGTASATWPVRLGQELNMTNDRRLFHTSAALLKAGAVREGEVYRGSDGVRYIPLREGRMIQAFDANAKRYVSGEGRSAVWDENGWPKAPIEPHYWVNEAALPEAYRSVAPRLYWCDVTGATNERTSMCAIVEGPCVSGHSLNTLHVEDGHNELLNVIASVMNSFVFDWYMRMLINQHMSLNFVGPAPCLREIQNVNVSELVGRVSSTTVGYVKRADARAELDAAVAIGYRLSYAELLHILESFPLIDRAEPLLPDESKSTITRDLVLAAYCRQSSIHDPEHAARVSAARKLGALGYVSEPLRKMLRGVTV